MLRDLPPVDRRLSSDEHLLMNGAAAEQTHQDPLDDVFGSAPSSPTTHTAGAGSVEHSDIPRLRSTHVTSGYREGIAVSKEHYIQEGFDEGFSLGGEIGRRAGCLLGVLEGIHAAARNDGGESVKTALMQAREELKVEAVLGKDYFGPDGIWTFDVPGQDVEGEVTFADVADAHPVLKKWKQAVLGLAEQYGLELR